MKKINHKKILFFSFLLVFFLAIFFSSPQKVSAAGEFITTWKTDNPGTSNSTSITIPTYAEETYNYDVDWNNDGIFDQLGITGSVTHDFGIAGTYTIQIRGNFPMIFFNNEGDKDKIISIDSWGSIAWTSMYNAFYGCSNLIIPATDTPDLSGVTNLYGMFSYASLANPDVSDWDVSNITIMAQMFNYATSANPDTTNWNVSNVERTDYMFTGATSANPDTTNWNVSGVINMEWMFAYTTIANPNTSNWDVGNVTNMRRMFAYATAANPDTANWDVGNVTDMSYMFNGATSANPITTSWNVQNVEKMDGMFWGATSANPDTASWELYSIKDMSFMFFGAISANPNVSNWSLSSVNNLSNMFSYASSANPDISNWDVSNVTDMSFMFLGVTLSTSNYDTILNNWSNIILQPNINFHAGDSKYCNSVIQKQNIIDNYNWSITDGGYDCTGFSIPDITSFITTWQTDANGGGTSPTSIRIPTIGTGYNYDVDWDNDGIFDQLGITGSVTHNFGIAGTYTIRIRGDFPRIYFIYAEDRVKLISVDQWGNIVWSTMNRAFDGCLNLNISATDTPNLSNVTDMSYMLKNIGNADSLNISNWDVSNVTNMSYMFNYARYFNEDISSWDVSSVTNMKGMFYGAESFNQPLNSWNTSSVNDMSYMFQNNDNSTFNQDISSWDVSNVTNMNYMFSRTPSFNQDISSWNTSSVNTMAGMFYQSTSFDQNIGSWDVSNITDASLMFTGVNLSTSNYDSLLSSWSSQILQNDVYFSGGNSKYCNSVIQRQNIIDNYNWSITDGGLEAGCTASPTVTTNEATSITQNTATLTGNILSTGGENPNIRGFEYWVEGGSTSITTEESGDFSTGEYSISISSLICDTTYTYVSYATNSMDTSYGDEVIFTTSDCEEEDESIINISDKIGINLNMIDANTITENGDYIVFTSIDEITSEMIIYLYNKSNDTTERISKIPEEEEISGDIIAVISENGEYIGIVSGVLGEGGAFLSLYNTISKENELIAIEEDIPALLGLFMRGSISISNNGDVLISPNFYMAMMSLMMIGGGSLPPEFSPIIFFYNNDNKEISIIEELTLENLYSPYSAHITSDGENIIYNTFFISSDTHNKYFIYNISKDEKEEIIINNNLINSSMSVDLSISNNGRYLAFWTMNLESMDPENFLIIIYDRQTEEFYSFSFFDFLSQTSFLEEEGALMFNSIDISNNGRYLVFSFNSFIKYMDSKNTNSYPLFIYDKIKNESLILDDGNSYMSASISGDGKYITFSSPDQLTDDDTDDLFDVFLMLNPLYQEEEDEDDNESSRRSSRSSGSSAGLINKFIQEQIQRASDVGIEDYVPDLCLNVPAIQTEIPSGWVTNDKYECFFEELPPQKDVVVVSPPEENIIRIPPKTETKPVVEEKKEAEKTEEIITEEIIEDEIIEETEKTKEEDKEEREKQKNFFIWLGSVLGDNYSKMANYIGDGVYDFFKTLLREQTGKTLATIVSTIGASLGIYFGLIKTLFVNPISLSEIPMVPIRLWNLMMIAFGFKKKTRPWGTVYDSTTKQPLDPVYVTVSDLDGNEVATCITDLDGRYGFLLPPGIYQIKAGKNNYQFPSNKLQGQTSDIIYQDLYFGGNIEVKEGEVVTKNIPMDSLTFDWNEFTKKDQKLMKFFSKRDLWVTQISDYLFGIGLIFSVFMIFISPSVYNYIVFAVYIILLILKNTILKPKLFGQVTNSYDIPLSFSILRFFRSGSDYEVIHKVTDQNGKYYCLVPNGSYYAKIENKNADESYTPVYTSESIKVKRGYIDEKFRV